MKGLYSILSSIFCRAMIASSIGLFLICAIFGTSSVQAKTAADVSYVRIIHASPYIGAADIFVDGNMLLNTFPFADITKYVQVPIGVHTVQISLVGKGVGASILTQSLNIEPGKAYTVAAIGATPVTLGLQVFVDDNQVIANKAKVRIYQLSPDAGTLNANVGGDTTLQDLSYENGSNYLTVDPGNCQLSITTQSKKTVDLTTNIASNSVTSVFAVGMVSGTPQIQLVSDQEQGTPGLPDTGSMPIIPDMASPSSPLWILGLVALIAASLTVTRHKFKHAL